MNTVIKTENLTKYYRANIILSDDCFKMSVNGHKSSYPELNQRVRYLGPVLVKGKKEPTNIYECFAGDLPSIITKKQNTLPLFNKGLEAYFNKSFVEAVSLLQEVVDQNEKDSVARHFLNKAALYITTGVPKEWTGVEEMEQK